MYNKHRKKYEYSSDIYAYSGGFQYSRYSTVPTYLGTEAQFLQYIPIQNVNLSYIYGHNWSQLTAASRGNIIPYYPGITGNRCEYNTG